MPNQRILYLTGQLSAGGSEQQLFYLVQAVHSERYRPAVVVWHYSDDDVHVKPIRALGVPLFGIDGKSSRISKLRTLRTLVRQLKPEVIHSYSFHTNAAAWIASLGTTSIAVGSIRNDFIEDKALTGPLLSIPSSRLPSYQICNSFAAAGNVKSARSVFVPGRLCVIRNGLDLKRFKTVTPSDNGRVRIVGVGSLTPRKRWDRVLTAAFALRKQGLDFHIRIAGDGPLRLSLEHQATHLGLVNQIEFLGYSDDIPGLLADATFIVHTADHEGCPNAVMEGMACGRAVVATDVGDVSSLIDDGETGFVARRGDDAMIVDRMAKLITAPDLCQRMGLAGRAKAEREFGLGRLVSQTLAAYQAAGWKRL